MEKDQISSLRVKEIKKRFMQMPLLSKYKYSIVCFPLEFSTGYMKGTEKGPSAIIEQSINIEPYDYDIKVNPAKKGIDTIVVNKPEQLNKLKHDKTFKIFLGGEHTITYFTYKLYESDLVIFDAHPDLMDIYRGKKLSHATWLKRLIEEQSKKGKKKHIYLYGIRTASEDENKLLKKFILKDIKHLRGKTLYLSIDLDVLDLSCMVACSNPEICGFNWRNLIESIKFLFKNNNVVAVDVVEHRPIKGLEPLSYAVSNLVYKIICLKDKYGKRYNKE